MRRFATFLLLLGFIFPFTPTTDAQLSFVEGSDGRQLSVSCVLPVSLDPPENVLVDLAATPPTPFASWSTNLTVDYTLSLDVDLTVYASAYQDSAVSGQDVWLSMGAIALAGYGTGVSPAGYAEARSDFLVSFQVSTPTPYLMGWWVEEGFFALNSDASGTIVESNYQPPQWSEFSGVLQPGEVYTLGAQAFCSTFNYPSYVQVFLQVIPEPTTLSLLSLGSLALVMRRWRK